MNGHTNLISLLPAHAEQLARLHISGIQTGFISSLGIDFVTALYEAISESKYGFGFVAVENERVVGFIAFTTDINSLYKSIIAKKGLRIAFLMADKMFSWHRLKKIFETIFYPSRIKKMELPKAELLSIAISDEAKGKGIATMLIQLGFKECAKRGIDKVKVLVGADNDPANKLYIKCGFELVRQIENHGILSNIYIADIKRS